MAETQKARRHSGWITPPSTLKCNRSLIINECLEPQLMYSDWDDFRDGIRGYNDKTKVRSKKMCLAKHFDVERWNKKIHKQILVRKARRLKYH